MKSKWKKRWLLLFGSMLTVTAVIAALCFAGRDYGAHQFKQPFQNGMSSITQQMNGTVSQFQRKFHYVLKQGDHPAVTRGHEGYGMNQFAQRTGAHRQSFERGHHRWFGFAIRSLLTIAFWGALIVLAIAWIKKRKFGRGRMGGKMIWKAPTALALHDHTNTNAAFLDQWEKEHQSKEDK
ncbi:hypothetical protein ACQCN2_09650 [Brevibacillus ginsengisoli]|uniref:hypothetical protein n=1 Tax=Brevibacillus ginsengisoli TaxID=363854 RepID=UPI003CFB9864